MYPYLQAFVESLLEFIRINFGGAGDPLQIFRKKADNSGYEWVTLAENLTATVGTGGQYSLLSEAIAESERKVILVSDIEETVEIDITSFIDIDFNGYEISNTEDIIISLDYSVLIGWKLDAMLVAAGNYITIAIMINSNEMSISGNSCTVDDSQFHGGTITVASGANKAILTNNRTFSSISPQADTSLGNNREY